MTLDSNLVLVIDDFPSVRTIIRRILIEGGYDVIDAEEGRDGVRAFRLHQPWLVITDILMVGQEGIETILELKRQDEVPKILAISGSPDLGRVNLLQFAASFGADAVLRKPFDAPELLKSVAALAAGRRRL